MNEDTPKKPCMVCGGLGGFEKVKKDRIDSNWTDCLYCDGYGFIEDLITNSERRLQVSYYIARKKINEELSKLATIGHITSEVIGKEMYIRAIPKDRKSWVKMVQMLLKFSHYHKRMDIVPKQMFLYSQEGNFKIHWELFITTSEISDLDGLIDLLVMYNSSQEGVAR